MYSPTIHFQPVKSNNNSSVNIDRGVLQEPKRVPQRVVRNSSEHKHIVSRMKEASPIHTNIPQISLGKVGGYGKPSLSSRQEGVRDHQQVIWRQGNCRDYY